ncbi:MULTISPECIES: hypothetical protein [Nocardia]|nr:MULTISPECIES: hypothetical protein [Nocardia]
MNHKKVQRSIIADRLIDELDRGASMNMRLHTGPRRCGHHRPTESATAPS